MADGRMTLMVSVHGGAGAGGRAVIVAGAAVPGAVQTRVGDAPRAAGAPALAVQSAVPPPSVNVTCSPMPTVVRVSAVPSGARRVVRLLIRQTGGGGGGVPASGAGAPASGARGAPASGAGAPASGAG